MDDVWFNVNSLETSRDVISRSRIFRGEDVSFNNLTLLPDRAGALRIPNAYVAYCDTPLYRLILSTRTAHVHHVTGPNIMG